MDELKQAYARLYRTLDGCARYQDLFTLPIQRPVLTCFTAVEGGRYRSAPIRFLLVGRAVNGWDEQRDYGDRLTLENFVASSVNNLKGGPDVLSHGQDRFEWVGDVESVTQVPVNRYRAGIDYSEQVIQKHPYRLAWPLWSYTKEIWCSLAAQTGDAAYALEAYSPRAWADRWFEHIAWTNLYKVAPYVGGNPDDRLKAAQQEACEALLAEEIAHFQPTHILFATGRVGWYDPFSHSLGHELRDTGNRHAQAAGRDGDCRIVVACRPEMRNKRDYVRDVVQAFVQA